MKKLLLTILMSAFLGAVALIADTPNNDAAQESGGAAQGAQKAEKVYTPKPLSDMFLELSKSTGISALLSPQENVKNEFGKEVGPFAQTWGRLVMFVICFILFYLGIVKQYEPLLLLPIAFGGLLANIPIADMAGPNGFLGVLYNMGIASGLFPLLIFMGVGAMTDFGPLLANPKTSLLGGAAQFGIFGTLVLAVVLSKYTGFFEFTMKQAGAISIIGGADGPTSIFVASRLAPELLGAIAVSAYSYMALVPLIQPPIMRALTTKKEREIKMTQLREVGKIEKVLFPISLVVLCALFLPDAAPLMGALCFGNLARECGVIERINDTLQNSLINIVTIFLGLAVGSKLAADKFLIPETLGIVVLGLIAFSFGTAAGVVMAKIMNKLSKDPINPLIGSAGVSAVPMAARVSQKEAQKANPHNFLLMHAMGPNVSGVIGSAVAAGVLLSLF